MRLLPSKRKKEIVGSSLLADQEQAERVSNKLDELLVAEDTAEPKGYNFTALVSRKWKVIALLLVPIVAGLSWGAFMVLGNKQEQPPQPISEAGLSQATIDAALEAIKEDPDSISKDETKITEKITPPKEQEKEYSSQLKKEAIESTRHNLFTRPQ